MYLFISIANFNHTIENINNTLHNVILFIKQNNICILLQRIIVILDNKCQHCNNLKTTVKFSSLKVFNFLRRNV